jgi:hypothetical protein
VVVGRELVFVFGYEFCLVMGSRKDRLRPVRPVFCQSLIFRNCERPKTRPWLRSLTVLRISSLRQSWDWTSKH